MTIGLVIALGVLSALCAHADASCVEPIFRLGPDYQYSWKKPRADLTWTADGFRLAADPGKAAKWWRDFANRHEHTFPYFVASEKAVVTFRYRSDVAASLSFRISTLQETDVGVSSEFKLPAAPDWKDFRREIAISRLELEGASMTFSLEKGTGVFEVKDFRIDEAPPARVEGRPLMLGDRAATEICVVRTTDPRRRINERRAALMLRYALYLNGGRYLPVKTVDSADDAADCSVVFDGGKVEKWNGGKVEKWNGVGRGGYEMAVKGGRLVVKADVPAGPQLAAWRLLEKAGIRYLGSDVWAPVPSVFQIPADYAAAENPAIPYRTLQPRNGYMCELRGMVNELLVSGNAGPAGFRGESALWHHALGQIVPIEELEKTHPEFLAMKDDGKRLTSKDARWQTVKYCYTNPEFTKLVAARYGEIMDAEPWAVVFDLTAGDGEQYRCTCSDCKAMASVSDVMYQFENRLAKILGASHPDCLISLLSYVDNPEPPKGPIEPPEKNLKGRYCIYPTQYWDSGLIWDNEANKFGFQALAAWRKLFPDLGPVLYYGSCEAGFLQYQPAFEFSLAAVRDAARHGAFSWYNLGLHGVHGNGGLNSGGLMDLNHYVLSRVAVDPGYDVEAGIDAFFRDFYGPAAPPMRKFFELTRRAYIERNWVTNCEVPKNGFITDEMADAWFAQLDLADKAAPDEKIRRLVRRDRQMLLRAYLRDVCRGRGNVPRARFSAWAQRVADFCRLSIELDSGYMDGVAAANRFFHDALLFDLDAKDWRWWRAPAVKRIIDDPEKALGADFPNRARKTGKGWLIPPTGMVGGQFLSQSRWMRRDPADARCVRRESSGFGLLQTAFDLDEGVPPNGVKLVLTGIRSEKKDDWPMMAVEVNGTKVFEGLAKWSGETYGPLSFDVPATALAKGRNEIVVRNPTPDPEAKFDGAGGANFRVKRDYNSSWFTVVSIAVEWQ